MKGTLIDLFDPQLPVLKEKIVNSGEQAFLYNIDRVKDKKRPQVLASASRVYDENITKKSFSFVAKSPINTTNVARILLPKKPQKITISDNEGNILTDTENSWDDGSKTCFLSFENSPEIGRASCRERV